MNWLHLYSGTKLIKQYLIRNPTVYPFFKFSSLYSCERTRRQILPSATSINKRVQSPECS